MPRLLQHMKAGVWGRGWIAAEGETEEGAGVGEEGVGERRVGEKKVGDVAEAKSAVFSLCFAMEWHGAGVGAAGTEVTSPIQPLTFRPKPQNFRLDILSPQPETPDHKTENPKPSSAEAYSLNSEPCSLQPWTLQPELWILAGNAMLRHFLLGVPGSTDLTGDAACQ
eukprot:3082256-Rhodomonas_salina.2